MAFGRQLVFPGVDLKLWDIKYQFLEAIVLGKIGSVYIRLNLVVGMLSLGGQHTVNKFLIAVHHLPLLEQGGKLVCLCHVLGLLPSLV
jgi:hypothetical protein